MPTSIISRANLTWRCCRGSSFGSEFPLKKEGGRKPQLWLAPLPTCAWARVSLGPLGELAERDTRSRRAAFSPSHAALWTCQQVQQPRAPGLVGAGGPSPGNAAESSWHGGMLRCSSFLVLWHHPVAAGRGLSFPCHHQVSLTQGLAERGPSPLCHQPPVLVAWQGRRSPGRCCHLQTEPGEGEGGSGAGCSSCICKIRADGKTQLHQDATQETLSLFPWLAKCPRNLRFFFSLCQIKARISSSLQLKINK